MPIQLKIACTPKEIDDALRLRHEVFVKEEGKYSTHAWHDEQIADRFDMSTKVAQILAYADEQPVAGLRLNCDMGEGLPPEAYFDFRLFVPSRMNDSVRQPVIASAGMLIIRRDWRRRHDLLPALYRKAVGVFYSWQVTHIIAVVSQTTVNTYLRAGFIPLADSFRIDSIGDTVVPILAKADDCYRWAFGKAGTPIEPVWPGQRHDSSAHQNALAP